MFTGREVGIIRFVWDLGICDLVSCCVVMIYCEGRERREGEFFFVGFAFFDRFELVGNVNKFGIWDCVLGILKR